MNTTTLGFLYAILAALGFALWNIFMQRAMERGAPARAALLTLGVSVTAISLPMLLLESLQGKIPPFSWVGIAYFVISGLLTGGVAPFHTTKSTTRIGAAQTVAVRLLDPMFAFIIALSVLGESFDWQATGGVATIMVALALLQMDRRPPEGDGAPRNASGLAWALGASFWFTVGTSTRKIGLGFLPSAPTSVLVEGLSGLCLLLPQTLITGKWGELRAVLERKHLDLWWSGIGGACGTLFVNMALKNLSFPIAVALRNTSPWFALILVPLILGKQHKPGWPTWISTLLLTGGMLMILLR